MANFCRYCGTPVRPNANFCPACGKSLAKASPQPESRQEAAPKRPESPHAAPQSDAARPHAAPQSDAARPHAAPQSDAARPHVAPQPRAAAPRRAAAQAKAPYLRTHEGAARAYPQPTAKPRKQRAWTLLFLLAWAGLLYLGWQWVPDAVRDARLPYVPVPGEEEELTEEEIAAYEEIDRRAAAGELEESDIDEDTRLRHSQYKWLYGADSDDDGEEEVE